MPGMFVCKVRAMPEPKLLVGCTTICVVRRNLCVGTFAELQSPDALFLRSAVLVFFLSPVLCNVPVLLLSFVFVLEPLRVVCELSRLLSTPQVYHI